MQTIGVSPKLWAAVASALLTHLLTQQLVDLPAWADLLIQLGAVTVSVYAAPPGQVSERRFDDTPSWKAESGYGLIEVAFAFLLVVVALLILFGNIRVG